jgi:hypothetical protein
MQVLITIDEAVRYGVAHVRELRNNSLPQTVQHGERQDGEIQTGTDKDGKPIMAPKMVPNMVANPDLLATDEEYIAWLLGQANAGWCTQARAAGVVAADPVPPAPVGSVPYEVTRRQARQALILAGKFDLVQPAINAIADPVQRKLMQSEWDDSQVFVRTRPALVSMGHAIGLDDAGLDALFIAASKLS